MGAEVPNNLRDIFPTFIMTINVTHTVVVLRKCEQINVQYVRNYLIYNLHDDISNSYYLMPHARMISE